MVQGEFEIHVLQVLGATVAIPRSVDFAQGVAAGTQVSGISCTFGEDTWFRALFPL